MPTWWRNTQPTKAPQSEQKFAKAIRDLPKTFTVLWKYYYQDDAGILREGDFIIQGPDGHILVVECKSSGINFNPRHGRYEDSSGTIDQPLDQLFAERKSVIKKVSEQSSPAHTPFVDAVLFLPFLIAPDIEAYHEIPRQHLVGDLEAQDLASWWQTRFREKRHLPEGSARELFENCFRPKTGIRPTSATNFWIKNELERISTARFEILDMLQDNPRFFVQGGPGTGKSWLALKTAQRWANQGKHTLLLCYNLKLEQRLKAMARHSNIAVHSFESLAERILGKLNKPEEREKKRDYWWEIVPSDLMEKITNPSFRPLFDALVVDEAQDHDTDFAPALGTYPGQSGWWHIYFSCLKNGPNSNIAVFFDQNQRLLKRPGQFDPDRLAATMQNPVRIHLDRTVRYTRQIRDFLVSLVSPSTQALASSMSAGGTLPEGSEVQVVKVSTAQQEQQAVQKLIHDWTTKKGLHPADFLILYRTTGSPPPWAKRPRLGQYLFHQENTLAKNSFHLTSINKARGLEAKAVILTGLSPWSQIKNDKELAHLFFCGASRAQQFLGIIERKETF